MPIDTDPAGPLLPTPQSLPQRTVDLRAEVEQLRAALTDEPILTEEQRRMMTEVTITTILPRLEILAIGWRMAIAHVRSALEQKADTE